MKKIFVILLMLVIFACSVSSVSAGLIGGDVSIMGIDFNIPDGFEEDSYYESQMEKIHLLT